MDIQSVPKIGISSVVQSKHLDSNCIDVIDNDIALFDTESVVSLYDGRRRGFKYQFARVSTVSGGDDGGVAESDY